MANKKNYPTEAIIAVTMNCNARCIMCNIWKNNILDEVKPDFYKKLPKSLKEINITGGEPFLRNDLPNIINILSQTCPQARLLINTNGYLTSQIKKLAPQIKSINQNIAIRISLDGYGETHTKTRRLPNFFEKSVESLHFLKNIGIKDLGISYTLMEQNKHELLRLYDFCKRNRFEFSLTVATDSPIYFGKGKINLRPKINNVLKEIFQKLTKYQRRSIKPKNWFRAWFNEKLLEYIETNIRHFDCKAGEDFFYLDSLGKMYACHIKPWQIGDLTKNSFEKIFFSKKAVAFRKKAIVCNGCWMICTTRSSIKKRIFTVLQEIVTQQIKTCLPI
jgi:MoaA/NifB/PqqE/SkfB family radical SAM enzyme